MTVRLLLKTQTILLLHGEHQWELHSKASRRSQEQKHTKSRTSLCFVSNSGCVQAGQTLKATIFLANKKVINLKFNMLKVHQKASRTTHYKQDLVVYTWHWAPFRREMQLDPHSLPLPPVCSKVNATPC